MLSNWLILSIVAGISSIFFNMANRQTLKNGHDSTVYAWLFEFVRLVIFVVLLPIGYYFHFSWQNLGLLLALGLSELACVYIYMKMHSHAELSVSSIISRLRVIIIPIFAYLFLAERLSHTQYLGIIIIFVGCMVVVGMKSVRGTKGLWYSLGFVLLNSISAILLKSSSSIASTSVVSVAFTLPSALLIPVIMRSALPRIKLSALPILKPTIFAALFNVVTMYTLVSALKLASAGQVNSVFLGVTSLSVIVGIFHFKEKEHIWIKIIGGILTTIGIVLLT